MGSLSATELPTLLILQRLYVEKVGIPSNQYCKKKEVKSSPGIIAKLTLIATVVYTYITSSPLYTQPPINYRPV